MIRAHINEPFTGVSGIEIAIVNHTTDQPPRILHLGDGQLMRWETVEDGDRPVLTITLPPEAGRALLEALTQHYNGAEDTRTLRRDYDAERRRVDDHAKVLADVVRSLAGRGSAA